MLEPLWGLLSAAYGVTMGSMGTSITVALSLGIAIGAGFDLVASERTKGR